MTSVIFWETPVFCFSTFRCAYLFFENAWEPRFGEKTAITAVTEPSSSRHVSQVKDEYLYHE